MMKFAKTIKNIRWRLYEWYSNRLDHPQKNFGETSITDFPGMVTHEAELWMVGLSLAQLGLLIGILLKFLA